MLLLDLILILEAHGNFVCIFCARHNRLISFSPTKRPRPAEQQNLIQTNQLVEQRDEYVVEGTIIITTAYQSKNYLLTSRL